MSMPELHPQLQADCHDLGRIDSGRLLLSRNASLHWLILVPDTQAVDLLDLPDDALGLALQDCRRISQWLKQACGYPKVNFGALGNWSRNCTCTWLADARGTLAGRSRSGATCPRRVSGPPSRSPRSGAP